MGIKTRRDRWAELHRSLLWMDLQRYWTALEHCAAGRNRKAVYRSTRNYNPHHHLIGVCGEFVYACHAGVTMSFVVDEFKGDGAVDFTIGTESVQVKTVPYLPTKWRRGAVTLVEFPDVKVDDMAAYYVLVTVDLTRQRGSIIGYADGQRMARAPIMNFGHGERRALRAVDLEPGIPRFEDPLPANFRAWQAARAAR